MRSVGGVVAGLAIAMGLMIGTNILLVRTMAPTAVLFLAVTLGCAAIYHLVSGYVCAAIARDALAASWTLILLGTAVLISSVIQTWTQMPRWYSVAMVVIVPVALWLGTWMHGRRGESSLPAAAI